MDRSLLDKILEKIDPGQFIQNDGKVSLPDRSHNDGKPVGTRKPIGELLVEKKKISREQLDDALKAQQGGKGKLGEILVENDIIDQSELQQLLAYQFDLPYFDTLPFGEIDPDLVRHLSRSFCLQNLLVPISRDGFGVTVAVAEPLNLAPVDDLRLILGTPVFRVVCPKNVIENAINSVFERQAMSEETLGMKDSDDDDDDDSIAGLDSPQDLLDDEEEAPVRRMVKLIIRRAVAERASDIHIEPFEDRMVVRLRIDSKLREIQTIPKKFQSSVITRIKIIGRLDIAESRIPQDGRIPLRVGPRDCDVRLSTLPTKWGERIVMRIQDKSQGIRELEKLEMPEKIYKKFEHLLRQPYGILFVTGPTGSGKTACLASALMHINRPDTNIITIEDPVEIIIPGAGQVEVQEKAGLTFAKALRSILRQDPNVILIQEIRDSETAGTAVQAAITGHLVLSTLHTNDTATAVTRLTDLGVEGYQIASSVIGVLAVRLLRRLCTTCREPVTHLLEELAVVGITPEQAAEAKIFKARPGGCPNCRNSGYTGRIQIFELLEIDEDIRNYIIKSSDGAGLKKLALQKGMMTLKDCAALRVLQGICSLEDAINEVQSEE